MASGSTALPTSSAPLVGRDGELALVEAALADPQFRIVTLTGPPGVGKTRLALAAAGGVESRFADGAAFVDLARVPTGGPFWGRSRVPSGSVRPARLRRHARERTGPR